MVLYICAKSYQEAIKMSSEGFGYKSLETCRKELVTLSSDKYEIYQISIKGRKL